MADVNEEILHQNISRSNADKPDYTSIAILSSLTLSIVAINSLVFFLFFKRKTLRTVSNYPLFSLAACDLFTGVVNIPLFIVTSFTSVVKSKSTTFHLGFVLVVFHTFVAIATVYHIVTITAERYMAIKMPLRHRLVNKKSVYKVLGIVWWTSLIISFIPFSWIRTMHPVAQPFSLKLSLGYTIFCLVVALVLPYTFLITAFVGMFKAISKGTSKDKEVLHRSRSVIKQKMGETKCLALFAIMAVVFAVCWFPSFIMFLLTQFVDRIMQTPYKVSLLVRYLTSVINPLLYTFLKRDFYHALKFTFSGEKQRRNSSSVTPVSRKGTMQTEFDQPLAVSTLNARRQSQKSPKEEEQQGEQCKLCKESPI